VANDGRVGNHGLSDRDTACVDRLKAGVEKPGVEGEFGRELHTNKSCDIKYTNSSAKVSERHAGSRFRAEAMTKLRLTIAKESPM